MIEFCVIDWNEARAAETVARVTEQCGIRGFSLSEFNHETVLLNRAIDRCQADYLWFLTSDLEIMYPETPHLMAAWMEDYPHIGAMIPNREGERYIGGRLPYPKYLEDGTALLYKLAVGARYDEELLFTGWSDLDFGNEIERRGYKVYVDPRICVNKHPTPYGSWSTFRAAYNARNRLLLEAKWYWMPDWLGVEYYNQTHPERRIPTIYELAWWSVEKQEAFAQSVSMEHPQILLKDEQGTGNERWTFSFG